MVTGGKQALDGRGEARVLCSLLPNREVPRGLSLPSPPGAPRLASPADNLPWSPEVFLSPAEPRLSDPWASPSPLGHVLCFWIRKRWD